MIVMCPGCSGIELDVIRREFKDEKIVCGCIGECGGRMDETIVIMVNGEFVEARSEAEFIIKARNLINSN